MKIYGLAHQQKIMLLKIAFHSSLSNFVILQRMNDNRKIKIAVLDLNNGFANQGMRCIQQIIRDWVANNNHNIQTDVFDVRQKLELPDLSYDVYISSGGPGSPLETINLK